MKTRWHLSLLLVLCLLWQGLAAAAVPLMLPAPAAVAAAAQPVAAANEMVDHPAMPEHCRVAGMHHAMKAKTKSLPAKAVAAKSAAASCCKPGSHCAGHCPCAMATASLSAMPMAAASLSLPRSGALRSVFAQTPPGALPPPDPLRPPISSVL